MEHPPPAWAQIAAQMRQPRPSKRTHSIFTLAVITRTLIAYAGRGCTYGTTTKSGPFSAVLGVPAPFLPVPSASGLFPPLPSGLGLLPPAPSGSGRFSLVRSMPGSLGRSSVVV